MQHNWKCCSSRWVHRWPARSTERGDDCLSVWLALGNLPQLCIVCPEENAHWLMKVGCINGHRSRQRNIPAPLLGDAARLVDPCALQLSCPHCAPVWDRRKHRARKPQARRIERNCQHRNPVQVQWKPRVMQHPSGKQHLSLIKIMQRSPVAGGKGKCRSAKRPRPAVRRCWPSHTSLYREIQQS